MKIDRAAFLAAYDQQFGGTLNASQTAGMNALLDAAELDTDITDLRWLAYMLATVKHECANTWKPIEEFGKGAGRPYGKPVTVTDPATGKSVTNVYYGRGYVQLTWKDNYDNMGRKLNVPLLVNPGLALDPDVAYRIMSLGMRTGAFTGKKLSNYINADGADYVNARRIINGTDQAQRIAGYATRLEAALRASVQASVPLPNLTPDTTPAAVAPPSVRG